MDNYEPYILYQIARFGAVTRRQLEAICVDKIKIAKIYVALRGLAIKDFVRPIINPVTQTRAYYATAKGRKQAFGRYFSFTTGVKDVELDHTVYVTQTLLHLSEYENVLGVASQFEVEATDMPRFCYGRLPDGIFQLWEDGQRFEWALECETSIRNMDRIRSVLSAYLNTFEKKLACSGVLIVTATQIIGNMYAKVLEEFTEEFRNRVRIVVGNDFPDLNCAAYGKANAGHRKLWELARTDSTAGIEYSLIKTILTYSSDPRQDPQVAVGGQQYNQNARTLIL